MSVEKHVLGRLWLLLVALGGGYGDTSAQSTDVLCPPQPIVYVLKGDLPPAALDAALPCTVDQCVRPDPPSNLTANAAQQATITATPYGGATPGDYYSLHVWVEYYNSSIGWTTLYRQESKDAVDRARDTSSSTVSYQAVGLRPGKQHRFSIAWCRKPYDRKGCNCWSLPSSAVTQPTSYATPKVPLTIGYVQEIEDLFARGATDPVSTVSGAEPGDGLGPTSIWSAPDGPRINTTGSTSYAYFPHTTAAKYQVLPSTAKTFTELAFRPGITR
jgi:hypothetical protein